MLDFFQVCVSALIADRRRPKTPPPERAAVARLLAAFALVALVFGALERHAAGARHGTDVVMTDGDDSR